MYEFCRVSDCDSPCGKRGLCAKHYQWLRRHGELVLNESETLTVALSRCSLDGCERNVVSSGLCSPHYQRWYKYGDPESGKRVSTEERFWSKVQKTDGCWLWTGQIDEYGKGRLSVDGRMRPAHRYAYEQHHGVVLGAGEIVRQTCKVSVCVNPEHLRTTSEMKVMS